MPDAADAGPERGAPAPEPAGRPYEAPLLRELGTLRELTHGVNPTSTDGVLPGSALG